jgi:hypothetical protein
VKQYTLTHNDTLALQESLRRANFTEEDMKMLCASKEALICAKNAVRTLMSVGEIEHLIDCSADPHIPNGCTLVDHKRSGGIRWNPNNIELYRSVNTKLGSAISGRSLRRDLAHMPVMNACVLDYLLTHPHLIPVEWKKTLDKKTVFIFFFGTIYKNSAGAEFVRCLSWSRGGQWAWSCDFLDYEWSSSSFVVLHK